MLIIGHRGCLSGGQKENTLEAFETAITEGVDMVELDVQLSLDGEIIVFHDMFVNRLTGHKGKVGDYTLQQLQPFKVTTLQNVLELVKSRCSLYIEIKGSWTDEQLLQLVELVEDYIKLEVISNEQIYFGSFNYRYCKQLLSLNRGLKVGYITCNDLLPDLSNLEFVCLHLEMLTEELFKTIKATSCQLWIFTIKNFTQLDDLGRTGLTVDGLVCDYPLKTIKYLNGEVIPVNTKKISKQIKIKAIIKAKPNKKFRSNTQPKTLIKPKVQRSKVQRPKVQRPKVQQPHSKR